MIRLTVVNIAFYHSEKLQSTKTVPVVKHGENGFYHSEKLQSTKTSFCVFSGVR